MKRIDSLIISIIGFMTILLVLSMSLAGQAPQSFNYQAIVRDADGDPLAGQQVSIRITIRQGDITGFIAYRETHSTTTSPLGLVNLQIGMGTIVSGNITMIDWSTGVYFLELELDPAGGTSYIALGTTQLLSVPYALFSEKSGQEYIAGPGIDISSDIITNTSPDQLTT
ncbi:MAG TPA: hypothetical protein P5184_08815, partial [Bacteroidales bacterium]|nr:hypothetical protein [Bacteroidales bacterium]